MITGFFNHFRLTWRLFRDKRVNGLLKFFLVGIPAVYVVLPIPFSDDVTNDFLPLIGLLDDFCIFIVTTIIFHALCPHAIVHEYKMILTGKSPAPGMKSLETYRCRKENRDLATGFLSAIALTLLGGYLAGIVLLFCFFWGYLSVKSMRSRYLATAVQVSETQFPDLYESLRKAQGFLPPVSVNLFVSNNPQMNAFTFGYGEPYTIVLNSALAEKFEKAEIQAVIGHELGHILFGHTKILSILAPQKGIGQLFFTKWSRSCEYSADTAAWLASNRDVKPYVSALLMLVSGLRGNYDVQAFLEQTDKPSAKAASLMEFLDTHPLINKRIKNILQLSKSG